MHFALRFGLMFRSALVRKSLYPLTIERNDMPCTLNVNGESATVDVPADMPLLWVIRDVLNLKGGKRIRMLPIAKSDFRWA